MVNVLIRLQTSTKLRFHYVSVLVYSSSRNYHFSVWSGRVLLPVRSAAFAVAEHWCIYNKMIVACGLFATSTACDLGFLVTHGLMCPGKLRVHYMWSARMPFQAFLTEKMANCGNMVPFAGSRDAEHE